ncbi:MAG: hypothetical protein CM1200mP41_06440 [Gammaproteobacteria bacterium]|nr:MAG: hypothetical protein CM1200mP41_06440 [Gammaproteobacteria bacterium]
MRVRSVDLEDGEAAAGLGRWTLEQFGRVDVLVNNAGHSQRRAPSVMSELTIGRVSLQLTLKEFTD